MPLILDQNPLLQTVKFQNTSYEPPTEQGGTDQPTIYTDEDKLILRDTDGVRIPMVVGANGAGVVSVAFADTPYAQLETDAVIAVDTTDGAVTITGPADGGWYVGQPLVILDAKTKFGTNACTFDGNGQTINGAATVVLSTDNASLSIQWGGDEWGIVASSAGAATPFNPHAPGPLGDDTPDTVDATDITADNATVGTFLKSDGEFGVKSVSLVGGLAGYVKQLGLALATAAVEQAFQFAGNAVLTLSNVSSNATSRISLHTISATLADNATVDYDNGGKGGLMLVVAAGATGSQFGVVSFARNAVTTLSGGPAYTAFSVTLTTANKLNVGASGGKVRIENKLGTATEVYALVLLGVAA